MGIFDRLRGKRAEEPEAEAPAPAAAAPAVAVADLTEAAPAAAAAFAAPDAEPTRLYNPYEGLGAALDRGRGARPEAFRLPRTPEFLFSEEAAVHRRSWSENLTYYTGAGYLAGAVAGGGAGAARALAGGPAVALAGLPAAASRRLRVNALLNASGTAGRAAGNALGALGLFFGASESALGHASDGRLPDAAATLGAGAVTGALYRSVRGPRQAAAAAAVGAAGGAAVLAARALINPGL